MRAVYEKKMCEKVTDFVRDEERRGNRKVAGVLLNPEEWAACAREANASPRVSNLKVAMPAEEIRTYYPLDPCRVVECARDLDRYYVGDFT